MSATPPAPQLPHIPAAPPAGLQTLLAVVIAAIVVATLHLGQAAAGVGQDMIGFCARARRAAAQALHAKGP